jgi:hypothetical protein
MILKNAPAWEVSNPMTPTRMVLVWAFVMTEEQIIAITKANGNTRRMESSAEPLGGSNREDG